VSVAAPQSCPDTVAPKTTLGRLDRFWLPIEDRSVVHFFNRNLYFPHQLRERVTAGARRLAAFDGGLLPKPPDLTTVLDSVTISDRHRLERAKEVVRGFIEDLDSSDAGEMTSADIHRQRWILIEDGSRTDRLIVLLFLPDQEQPTVALKIAPASAGSLTRERDALGHLHATLPEDLAASLPRPGLLQQQGEWQVLPLSIVEGRPAYVEMQASWQPRRHVARHLECASHWLARFHRETASGDAFLSQPAEQHTVMKWATRLEKAGVEETRWFEALLHRCQRDPISLSAGHGDFWARNLLVPDCSRQCGHPPLPGVIDWESYRPRQLPFVDLFHFAVTYGLNYLWARYRRIEPLAALRSTFIDDTHLSREIRHCFNSYCLRMELDPAHLGPFFQLYLLRLSTGDSPSSLDWSVRSHPNRNTWLDFHRLVRHAKITAVDQ